MLTILLYGDAKVGKSRLAATAPAPRLILDAEGRSHYLPGEQVTWDVLKEEPPAPGDWETCVADVKHFQVLQNAYAWLQSGKTPFKSVVIDSLTEAQKRYIDKMVGLNQMETQDWGEVLRQLEKLVRDYRDLVKEPGNGVGCVAFICGEMSDDKDGKRRPLLQGSLRRNLAYLVDVCGYMYVTHDSEGKIQRNLRVAPTQAIVAGDGTDRIGIPVVGDPNLTAIYDRVTKEPS